MKRDYGEDCDYDHYDPDERRPHRGEEETTEESSEEGFSSSSSSFCFDFDQLPKDYYKVLEVDYDATEEVIRSSFIRLALKWHPDKRRNGDGATSRFQEINEAYQVLGNSIKKREYDKKGLLHLYDHNIREYLNRHKSLILTCHGLGGKQSLW